MVHDGLEHPALELIRRRASVEAFDESRPLDDDEIRALVSDATRAPSSFNIQHWRFIAVRRTDDKRRLQQAAYGQDQVARAAVTFIILGDLEGVDRLPRIMDLAVERGALPEGRAAAWVRMAREIYADRGPSRDEAIRSASLAAMTLMLAAEARGLAAGALTGFDPLAVSREFGIPARCLPVMLLAVGHPLEPLEPDAPRMPRLPLDEVLAFDRWDDRRGSCSSRALRATMNRVLGRLAEGYDIDRFVRANGESPFRILVGCIISLRTRDEVTFPATERLFARAATPAAMARLREETIARLIYPAGFYRRKSEQIRRIAGIVEREHDGQVPREIDALLELPGVGRKTANLVVTLGFGDQGICVDVHVHRIANRLGWIETDHPDTTETVLRETLPRRWWIPINETLVRHGQQVCRPQSPLCSECPVARSCRRVGVERSR